MKVWQVSFAPCLMHGPKREERSGQKGTSGLEKNIPFSQALKVHTQNLSGRQRQGPASASAWCHREALQPLCLSLQGWQRPGWGYRGTPCFPQHCLSRQRAGPLPAWFSARRGRNLRAPSPPSTSLPAPGAWWHSCARTAESAPSPATDPPLFPLPLVSVAFHCERVAAVLRHGRVWCRTQKSSGTWQSTLGSSPGSYRVRASSQVLHGMRDDCNGAVYCAKVCWRAVQGAVCW